MLHPLSSQAQAGPCKVPHTLLCCVELKSPLSVGTFLIYHIDRSVLLLSWALHPARSWGVGAREQADVSIQKQKQNKLGSVHGLPWQQACRNSCLGSGGRRCFPFGGSACSKVSY